MKNNPQIWYLKKNSNQTQNSYELQVDQLIKSCIKKDRKAQETLYNLYKTKLFPICLKYCSSHSEAQDHLHDTFITIFENIKKYKGEGSFEGWMKRITINKAIDNYKKKNTFELADYKAAGLSDDNTIYTDELPLSFDTIMSLIHALPPQYRIIFNLYELDDYPHKEIALRLGISESTSKSNLHRAKALLKEKISNINKGALKTVDNHAR